jgi:hypothetical protein
LGSTTKQSQSYICVGAKNELLLKGGFVEHLSQTFEAQQSVTKFITIAVVNLVTTNVAANVAAFAQQTGLNRPDVELLNRDSLISPALGVTKCIIVTDIILLCFLSQT